MSNIISNVVIAVFASLVAVIIFQGIQYAFFSEILEDVGFGNYTQKGITIEITNITNDFVTIYIPRDEQVCLLRERESCYSGCHRISVVDIKGGKVDIDVVDDILCEVQRSAYEGGRALMNYLQKGKEGMTNILKNLRKTNQTNVSVNESAS